MVYYDEQLRQLQAQCSRYEHLEVQLKELWSQRADLSVRARDLRAVMLEEQADVDKLEGRSLAAFFYSVIGKMDEQLTKEREEAYRARVKYDAVARELSGVEEDIRRYSSELSSLRGCDSRYEALLKEKANAIKFAGGSVSQEILNLERQYNALTGQKTELQEAISAGQSALGTIDNIMESLASAEMWGKFDLYGGGALSTLSKHEHLDRAQDLVEQLQSQLRRFKTELADVQIDADVQVSIDGFLRFADYFFDGLFADWTVLDRISQSQDEVLSAEKKIERTMDRLTAMLTEVKQESIQVKGRLDELVMGTQV